MKRIFFIFILMNACVDNDVINASEPMGREYSRLGMLGKTFFPHINAPLLKRVTSRIVLDSHIGKRINDAAERGQAYPHLRAQQLTKHYDYDEERDKLVFNGTKETLETVGQQLGYIAIDSLVSEAADRLTEIKQIKDILESDSVQSVMNNVSEENKKFLKDQAIFVSSALLVDEAYKLNTKVQVIYNNQCKKDYDAFEKSLDRNRYYNSTLYNAGGIAKAIGGAVFINGLDHFMVKKYLSDDLKEASPLISWGLCRYIVFPVIGSLFKK